MRQKSARVVSLRNICPLPQVSAVTRIGNMLIEQGDVKLRERHQRVRRFGQIESAK